MDRNDGSSLVEETEIKWDNWQTSSLLGPMAYASAAPQHAGLLCNPELDVPALTTKSSLRVPSGQKRNYI
jgi:hypothetical protein